MFDKLKEGLVIHTVGRIFGLPLLVFSIISLGGCKTLPQMTYLTPWEAFPPERILDLYIPVQENRGLLHTLLLRFGRPEAVQMLDPTLEIYAAILPPPSTESPFIPWALILVGEYSPLLLHIGLTPEDGWIQKKHQTKVYSITYFQHTASNLQVSLPRGNFLILSSGGITSILHRLTLSPVERVSARIPPLNTNSIGIYIPQRGVEFLSPVMGDPLGLGSPGIESFLLQLEKTSTGMYNSEGAIIFQKEEQARSVSVLLRLGIAGWILGKQGQELSPSLRITARDSSVLFSGIPFSEEFLINSIESFVDRIFRMNPL